MQHGPDYRPGRDGDLESFRARRRFGHHKGDQAVKARRKGRLTPLICLALVAVTLMVFVRNTSLLDVLVGAKSAATATVKARLP